MIHGATSFFDHLVQAGWALWDNRLRTILSMLGIMVGIAAVVTVGTLTKGGHHMIFRELHTFGLTSTWVFRAEEDKDPNRAVREGSGIDNDDLEVIRSGCCPAVKRVTPMVMGWVKRMIIRFGNRYSHGQIEGVGSEYTRINNDTVIMGRHLERADELRRKPVVIIGPTVRSDLFMMHDDPVGKEIYIDGRKFVIVGVLETKSRDFMTSIGVGAAFGDVNNRILMPFTVLQQMLGKKEIDVLQAEAVDLGVSELAVSQMVRVLQHRHDDRYSYKGETMAQYISTANRILQGVSVIGVVAASVSLLVGALGIMNMMGTSVLERTREIGLRKAIGARRRDILLQFLLEAALISSVGGFLGLILGSLVSYALTLLTGFPLMTSWMVVIIGLVVSVGVGLLSGYYPARRAAMMHPVEALRYE